MKTQLIRAAIGVAVVVALVTGQATRVLAGTTGVITGTVTNVDSHAPLADVKITAVSPSGSYATSTDAHGFYSMTGVSPDTYTMTFSLSGYQSNVEVGVTVVPDTTAYVSAALQKSAKVLSTVSVRAQASAFQPKQTQDTYTVTTATINTIQGNSLNISESNLITSLPGASTDSSGYPTIRGGRENEQGFEFEGIPYVDAFTNQFTNTLATPGLGLQAVQLTPGAGNASFGNIGTGTLNLVAKRGSYPGYASVEQAIGAPNFQHDLNVEFGTAAPDGRWSEYATFAGQNTAYYYGRNATTSAQLLVFGAVKEENDREVLNNFVYKFGRNMNQNIQFFYDEAQHDFIGGLGGNPYCFTTCSPPFQDTMSFYSGLFNSGSTPFNGVGLTGQQIEQIVRMDPYQAFPTETLAQANRPPYEYYQPNNAFKLQWEDSLSSGTFVTAKAYRVNAVTTFDFPEPDGFVLQQGGFTNGAEFDLTTQLGDKNLLQAGVTYAWLHPVYDQPSDIWGLESTLLGGGDPATGLGAFEAWDFLSAADLSGTNNGSCPSTNPTCLSYCPFGGCGYLDQFFTNGQPPHVPNNTEQSVTNRQDYAAFLDNTWSPSDAVKVEYGIREDMVNYKAPAPGVDPLYCTTEYEPTSWNTNVPAGQCPIATFNNATNAQLQPRIPQPRFATSWQMGNNDSVRFSYGRSVHFPPLGQIDLYDPLSYYAQFLKVPSFDYLGCALFGGAASGDSNGNPFCEINGSGNLAPVPSANGGVAALCGIPGFQVPCKNYGEQLLWENQNLIEGVPLQPVKPETFNNYDFSYSHQFPDNFSFKVTPWYRRGYDATASVQSPLLSGGKPVINPSTGGYVFAPPVATNLGVDKATGVEFLLTKTAARGLSGQVSVTYQNEFSNVIPLSASEDFFPSIPPASLQLGNLYHVGFLSPLTTSIDLNYTTPSGWRISPQYQWNIGYPQGAGLLTAAYIDGVPYNIPNTNASSGINEAPNGTIAYVDPLNPGSFFFPNVAATRGTPEGPSPGSKLSHPDSFTNLTVEYHQSNGWLYGATVDNIFNDVWSGAALNARYQPVATGLSGPLTGLSHTLPFYPTLGHANYTQQWNHGFQPYVDTPNNFGRTFYFYVQTKV